MDMNDLFEKTIQGTCLFMCPEKEIDLRVREGLIHQLEGVYDESRRLIPIRSRVVKEYIRPAAGKVDPKPCDLRPAHVLKKTVNYLLSSIATQDDRPWSELYDFVFDRLRSVRQDMVIQNIEGLVGIEILEKIVRFHVYAGYRLCTQPLSVYDPKINEQHTQECLKRLLSLYGTVPADHLHQEEFESLYLMFNLGQTDALMHYYDLPECVRNLPLIRRAYQTSISYILGNAVRCLRLLEPEQCRQYPLFLCAAHRHINTIQSKALHAMSCGFHSKTFTYPLVKLTDLLWYTDIYQASASCEDHGLVVKDRSAVLFQKTMFKYPNKIMPSHIPAIDKVLKKNLAEVFLHGGHYQGDNVT